MNHNDIDKLKNYITNLKNIYLQQLSGADNQSKYVMGVDICHDILNLIKELEKEC